jgi:hypothetical protein
MATRTESYLRSPPSSQRDRKAASSSPFPIVINTVSFLTETLHADTFLNWLQLPARLASQTLHIGSTSLLQPSLSMYVNMIPSYHSTQAPGIIRARYSASMMRQKSPAYSSVGSDHHKCQSLARGPYENPISRWSKIFFWQ